MTMKEEYLMWLALVRKIKCDSNGLATNLLYKPKNTDEWALFKDLSFNIFNFNAIEYDYKIIEESL